MAESITDASKVTAGHVSMSGNRLKLGPLHGTREHNRPEPGRPLTQPAHGMTSAKAIPLLPTTAGGPRDRNQQGSESSLLLNM